MIIKPHYCRGITDILPPTDWLPHYCVTPTDWDRPGEQTGRLSQPLLLAGDQTLLFIVGLLTLLLILEHGNCGGEHCIDSAIIVQGMPAAAAALALTL